MDANQTAHRIVQEATDPQPPTKNQAAVELGRRGGLKGGKARAESMTPAQRSAAARHAAHSRWRTVVEQPPMPPEWPALRGALRWTRHDLAYHAGVTTALIGKYEREWDVMAIDHKGPGGVTPRIRAEQIGRVVLLAKLDEASE